MEFNCIKINNQLCRVYYAFYDSEMGEMYNELVDSFEGVIGRKMESIFKMYLYEYIENQLLEERLLLDNIICVSNKEIRHLIEYKKNKPFIGVAVFATLPIDKSFVLPNVIEEKDDVEFFNKANMMFKEIMLKKDFCYREKSNIIKEDSLVVYDLNCMKNGVLINTIENQEFNMASDDEFDSKLFLNCQIGDHIIVDQDEFINEAVIKDIYEKKPYNEENFDLTEIEKFDCSNFGEFRNKFIKAKVNDLRQQDIINKFIDSVIKNNKEYKLSKALIDFYKKMYEISYDECVRKIYTDYFLKIFSVKDNIKVNTEEADAIMEDVFILDLGVTDDINTPLYINKKFNEYKIIKALKQRKIIK